MKSARSARKSQTDPDYSAFSWLDGRHPWRAKVPEGQISYPARTLEGGKVSYFNFDLAKEMGLLAPHHPHQLNRRLVDRILETFCLRIINEYDQNRGTRFDSRTLKAHPYMATRYLQLQHADKTGRTSGDGRCIWNGSVTHRGVTWDVSSRGTGVTALAPGAVIAGKPLRSGNSDHGYGCGLAEIDELFGAAILAEIFHRNGIRTERVLAIIDLGKGVGIGVRAAPNLLRPAHLFMFLKQGKWDPLRRAADYLIDRQFLNKRWEVRPDAKNRYPAMLEEVTREFAQFVAQLDRDYIFAWLDWDGDNVLADGGIIDYGSVRQFGLRHDQYRYDDVDRFSTNLNEQRLKARKIVQTFAQLVDFLQTGRKKPLGHFRRHPALRQFDAYFKEYELDRFLFQMGFVQPLRRILLNRHLADVRSLFACHSEFERAKTARKLRRVADGVHRPAIFNMRRALSHMAEYVDGLAFDDVPLVEAREFHAWILSLQASRRDAKLDRKLKKKIERWQRLYLRLARKISGPASWQRTTHGLCVRAARINHESRITGNALIHIVDEILRLRRRGLSDAEVQIAIDGLISSQSLNPDYDGGGRLPRDQNPIVQRFLSVLHGYREDI